MMDLPKGSVNRMDRLAPPSYAKTSEGIPLRYG
jgi:hypothetical protein